MGMLLIKRPATGHEFSTGIQVGGDTLARVPQEFTHTHCPYCRVEHSWLPERPSSSRQSRRVIGSKIRIGVNAAEADTARSR